MLQRMMRQDAAESMQIARRSCYEEDTIDAEGVKILAPGVCPGTNC